MVRSYIILSVMMLLFAHNIRAQHQFVERTTDVLCLAPTITGLCVAITQNDADGAKELGFSTASALLANYALEATISKKRPDGSGGHAFPSTHTMMAFNGATFIARRYGWKWAIPAYAASAYIAWGRTKADKHDWWDVLGGAVIGTGTALIFTHRLSDCAQLTVSPTLLDGYGKGVRLLVEI